MKLEKITYCIITDSIGAMGGAQLYTLRRINYLKRNNNKIIVISGSTNNFILKNQFDDIEILVIPEIRFHPLFFSKKVNLKVKKIINEFLEIHKPSFLESHTLNNSIYGEVAASKIKAKHIIYLLNEDKVKKADGINFSSFIDFKLKRGELFGVSNMSLRIILNRNLDESTNKYINIPFDKTELDNDLGIEFLQDVNQDAFIIATVARLDKSYIEVLIKDVIKIANKFSNKYFSLLIIGNSQNKKIIERLSNRYKSKLNITIIFTGYIYPVPAALFKKIDIFIGQGTASVNSISQGCATAVIDSRDNKTSGFLGVHTNNFGVASMGFKFSIYDLLENAILNPETLINAGQKGLDLFEREFELNVVMNRFDQEIINSSANFEYWTFGFRVSMRRMIEMLSVRLTGIKGYEYLFNKAYKVMVFINKQRNNSAFLTKHSNELKS